MSIRRALLLTVTLPCALWAGNGASPHDAGDPAPALLDVRVLDTVAWPGPDATDGAFLVEVRETLNGWVPATVLVVRCDGSCSLLDPGLDLRVVVRQVEDGSYEVLSVRETPPSDEVHDPMPAPLVAAAMTPVVEPRLLKADPSYEQQVVELVNQERWSYNNLRLPPLKQVDTLHTAAETHSSNMTTRDFFMHCDPDTGSTPGTRAVAAGYGSSYVSENIAAGYSTPSAVVAGWMGSSGHRSNILSTTWRELGVGYTYQSGDQANVRQSSTGGCPWSYTSGPWYRYWTQNFGVRAFPVVINREAYETTTTAVDLYVYGVGWAVDMRFSNNGSTWSAWQAYNPNRSWTLSTGNGTKTVYAQVRNGATVYQASDTIILNSPCTGHPDTVTLQLDTVTSSETHEACVEIVAGPSYTVMPTGDLALTAPRIALRNGFAVESGGSLTAGGW